MNTVQAQCPDDALSGNVFLDTSNDGSFDTGEAGVGNVMVNAYGLDGLLADQAITNSAGYYLMTELDPSDTYKIIFVYPSNYSITNLGADNGSEIQFSDSGNCNVSLGLSIATTNCIGDADIFLTCFVRGQSANNTAEPTIIGTDYSFNVGSNVTKIATKAETGSIWGLAYDPIKDGLYSSAFVKQYASLTSNGHDAIFFTDINTQTTSLFTNLSSLGASVGTMAVTNPMDCNYGDQVGRYGIGAIALSDDAAHLYATNMFDNTIVKMPTTSPTAANSTIISVPNPGCANGDHNVFALKMYNGKLYVGTTCTSATAMNGGLSTANVFEMDITTNSFNLIFSTPYIKGYWYDSPTNIHQVNQWLTDIDFTSDGNMVLGITDRLGHRFCDSANGRVDVQFGDILMVFNNNGIWTLESNGAAGTLTGTGNGNNQGPGGGEFFGDDYYPGNPNLHPEVALGSIFINPGSNEVITSVFDPLFSAYSGGLHRYNTSTGSKVDGIELYNNDIDLHFGKATGFGDIVGRCEAAPIETGNTLWCDENKNGNRDAGEPGIANVSLQVYDDNCQLVGTTTTDADGNFVFGPNNIDLNQDGTPDGFEANTNYCLVIDPVHYNAAEYHYDINGQDMIIGNLSDQESAMVKDFETCSNVPKLGLVKMFTGANNSYDNDIGLVKAKDFDLGLFLDVQTPAPYRIDDQIEFDVCIVNQGCMIAKEYSLVFYLGDNFEFNENLNPGWRSDGTYPKYKVNEILCPEEQNCIPIVLTLSDNDEGGFNNAAEISGAINQFCVAADDIDSTPDDDPDNDDVLPGQAAPGGADDDTEDDFDDFDIPILDLALKKTIRTDKAYVVGEEVIFDIMICNQGTEGIKTVDVVEYFPDNLGFDLANNPGWSLLPDGTPNYSCAEHLDPGECKMFEVKYTILTDALSACIVSESEIAGFMADNGAMSGDIDSTPDADENNDSGGEPDGNTDNYTDGDGSDDEDDHDPVVVKTTYFDLALQKTAQNDRVNVGDLVVYDIVIQNQGLLSAYTVSIVDYLPAYTTLEDPSWTPVPTDPSGQTVMKVITIPGGLVGGAFHHETITVRVNDFPEDGAFITNYAEITCAEDANGVKISDFDIDSDADDDPNNDSEDEDDRDPASIFARSSSIDDPCVCRDNATTMTDGQFEDLITVTAPCGEVWYIDFVNNLFDETSTPGVLVPYVTGPAPAGFTLLETCDPLTGIASYTMTGVFETGQFYDIRLTNGEGDFQQVSAGGCKYNYPEGGILGAQAACEGSLNTYSIVPEAGCTYAWTIDGDGAIVTNSTETTIDVQTIGAVSYTLSLTQICGDACDAPIELEVPIGTTPGGIKCIHELNVGLDADCAVTIVPEMLLVAPPPAGVVYAVMLTDPHGNIIPNNVLTDAHKEMEITAKLIDACSGNSCWATLTVEDKTPPTLNCGDFTVDCNEMDTYRPIAIDNCSNSNDIEITLVSETITPLHCDPLYIKEVERIYIAEDECGNVSEPCTYTFKLERLDFSLIEAPADFLIEDGTAIKCPDLILDDEGFPAVSQTGAPLLDGWPIYPDFDFYCNLAVDYSTIVVNDSECNKKYMRTWILYEAWCSVGQLDTIIQVIEVEDTVGPTVIPPVSMVMSTNQPECTADVFIDLPEMSDDCTTNFLVDITYPGGFFNNVTTGQHVNLETGDNIINYTVYDACGNSATAEKTITIMDDNPPVAICDEFTVVALRSDGTAEAYANVFDDGSYDDCSLRKVLVRKMPPSLCECPLPAYNDHSYLGEHTDAAGETHHYYLSTQPAPGYKAIALAAAHGGYLVEINDATEGAWITSAVNAITTNDYYIGVVNPDLDAVFEYASGGYLGYANWTTTPPAPLSHVVANTAGTWDAVDGIAGAYQYVIELDDPCDGFSDFVSFCCDEVTANPDEYPMVIFRAIDYFGSHNDCMVTVEVQDKVPPVVTCPAGETLECGVTLDLSDAGLATRFGEATATDACVDAISVTNSVNINSCGVGTITRTFSATDGVGTATCVQLIRIENSMPFDSNTIVIPDDVLAEDGCQGDFGTTYHPDNLNGYPTYDDDHCDMVAATYTDEVFQFANDDTTACFKILRKWTIIDWCQMPGYIPYVAYQTIKVNNTVAPVVAIEGVECVEGADPQIVNIPTFECDKLEYTVNASATDSCSTALNYDVEAYDADNNLIYMNSGVGNNVSVTDSFPLGLNNVFFSFEDGCGNKTTCSIQLNIFNNKPPTAVCSPGVNIALEPMDTSIPPDGIPDTEMACITTDMLDASSAPACPDETIILSFSPDFILQELCFDCDDIGTDSVTLYVFNSEMTIFSECETWVEIQDNNAFDFCPEFDLALRKTVSTDTVSIGDDITFDIWVFNQGDSTAFNIELVDYIPTGLTLNDMDWVLGTGGMATLATPIPNLAAGDSILTQISFIVNGDAIGTIRNAAEIKAADDDMDDTNDDPSDTDSDPDMTDNDPEVDDDIDDDPDNPDDEDDHDPEEIFVEVYDLALIKQTAPGFTDNDGNGVLSSGDGIIYNIVVFNQGNIPSGTFTVTDYIPADLLYDPANATNVANGWGAGPNPSTTIGSLAPGASTTVQIALQIDPAFVGTSIVNNAEITSDSGDDIDSEPGDDTNNPPDPNDDDPNDFPDGDDDYDPEAIDGIACTQDPVCVLKTSHCEILDATGMVTLDVATVLDSLSSDPCGRPLVFEPATIDLDCGDVGTFTQSIRVYTVDMLSNGTTVEYEDNCTIEITVKDNIAPEIVCTATTPVIVQIVGGAIVDQNGDPLDFADFFGLYTITDNCENLDSSLITANVDLDNLAMCGVESVTLTVIDNNNMLSDLCTIDIQIEDTEPPVCTVTNDVTINVGDTVAIADLTFTYMDNCSTQPSDLMITPNDYPCDMTQMYPITLSSNLIVFDAQGNSDTCDFMVTVEDNVVVNCDDVVLADTVYIPNVNPGALACVDVSSLFTGMVTGCAAGDLEVSITQDKFGCNEIGTNSETVTVTVGGVVECAQVVSIVVLDTFPPMFTCPDPVTFNCGDNTVDLNNLAIFGMPIMSGNNCPVTIIENPALVNLNDCGIGTITRSFVGRKFVGDGSTNDTICTQLITINPPDPTFSMINIVWPPSPFDLDDCNSNMLPDTTVSGGPSFINYDVTSPCVNLSIDFVDTQVSGGGTGAGSCAGSWEREFTVIDSCQLNANTGAGIFMFTQIINLNDTIAPQIVFHPMDTTITLAAPACDAFVNLPATAVDACGIPVDTTWNDSPYALSNNGLDASGTYPAGITKVSLFAADECGNTDTVCYDVILIDTLVEGLNCNKIIAQLPDTLTLPINASDFQVTVDTSANCMPVSYTVSYSNTNPLDTVNVFGCNDLGDTFPELYLWTGNMLVDSCTATLTLTNPTGGCPQPPGFNEGIVTGQIKTDNNETVDNVEVGLMGSGTENEMTNLYGQYAFPAMPFGGEYDIIPTKNIEHSNGVTTMDIIRIQEHLLGLDPLTTPYKIIAADIDRSNSVTSLDVIELRKLVLGIYTELPNNTSWRMVDAGFTFLDPSAPFSTDIPESYQIPNLTGDMDIDFIGIKVGDVNNTAVANVNDDPNADRSGETSYLVAEEAFLEPGIYEINFSARDLANIAGFQFTLNANPLRAQLLNFKPNAPIMTDKHYSDQYMDRGIVSCSWDTKQQLETGDILFTATINVIEASWVSEIFELSSDVTFKEAYANGDINDIAIAYERSNIDEGMVLYQNNPNPWSDQTEITFFISEDSDITFNVFDVNGRLIHYKNIEAEEGLNTIMLDRNDISGYGVMYYELVNEDQRLIKKMILIK